MRILLIGAGGVGDAIVKIAATRHFYEHIVVADFDLSRAENSIEWVRKRNGEEKAAQFTAAKIDASNAAQIVELAKAHNITHILNAVEPKFVNTVFAAAFTAGVHYAADYLFSEITEISVKDGGNLVVRNEAGEEIFAPSFSIWTTIEECLNPPLLWTRDKGWHTTMPFSEPEIFEFPEGIGNVECVNVEHEEVAMLPRTIRADRFSFKYGLGSDFIGVLKTLHMLGLDGTKPTRVRSLQGPVDVAPRDMVVSVLPNPADIGPRMSGKTCAGTLVLGKDKNGRERATYLYHAADNEWTMANYESQCVVWQTAFNPLIALELMAEGIWRGAGVLGPEHFDAKPFLDLMSSSVGYNIEWKQQERLPASPLRQP